MKVIFLDVDGVLNHASSNALYSLGGYNYMGIEPEKVALLNKIVEATGAHVVLSSAWRTMMNVQDFQSYMDSLGFVGQVIGATDVLRGHIRGDEIERWLTDWPGEPVNSYVIIDDRTDMREEQLANFVTTSWSTGLTDIGVADAIRILGRGEAASESA